MEPPICTNCPFLAVAQLDIQQLPTSTSLGMEHHFTRAGGIPNLVLEINQAGQGQVERGKEWWKMGAWKTASPAINQHSFLRLLVRECLEERAGLSSRWHQAAQCCSNLEASLPLISSFFHQLIFPAMIFNIHISWWCKPLEAKKNQCCPNFRKCSAVECSWSGEGSLTANLFSNCPKYTRDLHSVLWLSQEKRNNEFGAIAFSPLEITHLEHAGLAWEPYLKSNT